MFGGWAALLLLAVSFTSLFIHYLLKKCRRAPWDLPR
jgi:hypothetical protein